MEQRDEKADREGYENDREKYDEGQKEEEVGYSHGYYGGFGREGKLFGDTTEDVSEPEREGDAAGGDEKS